MSVADLLMRKSGLQLLLAWLVAFSQLIAIQRHTQQQQHNTTQRMAQAKVSDVQLAENTHQKVSPRIWLVECRRVHGGVCESE